MGAAVGKKLIELEIHDLSYNGQSVAYNDGKVVFLNAGLPGETVTAEITRSKPRFDNAIVHDIIKKCDQRIPARCSHFGSCGGCTWQDLDYKAQVTYKRKQVVDCLEHLGGLKDVQVNEMIGCAELFNYRNKMEFSFHTAGEDDFTLGLHVRGRFDEVFDLEHCYLQSDLTNRIVHWFRDFVKTEGIPVYDVIEHTGFMRFLMLRVGKRTGEVMVNVVTNIGVMPNAQRLVQEMRSTFPEMTTLVHNQNGSKSNIATGEIEHVLYGMGYIEEKLFESRFRIRANSFFQTNTIQAEALYRTAFDLLDPNKSEKVLDLYCGTGSIGILLAPHVQQVTGVELVADAIKSAHENAALNEVSNAAFFHGDVKDFLKSQEGSGDRFDSVIVDPPRAGLHPKALRRLLRLEAGKILYISCNPATFARDAKLLCKAGYTLPEIRPVDMFPHTMHIEVAGVFYRQ